MATTTAAVANNPGEGLTSTLMSGYTSAALLAIGYGILSLAISSTVLARRDVTS